MNERNDDRNQERFGLEAFDEIDPPDQWNEITRRAESTGLDTTVGDRTRRSPATWMMTAAAVALVAVAAVAISVRSDDGVAPTPATTPDVTLPTPDTEPPTTMTSEPTNPATSVAATTIPATVPDSTVPPTTEETTTVPTTVAPAAVVDAWEPDCVDRSGVEAEVGGRGPKIASFVTLGEEPTLDIALPTIETTNGVGPPLVLPAQVPGGVAFVMHQYVGTVGSAVAIVVVDVDGSLRWQRCLDGTGRPSALIVGERELWVATNGEPTELRAFDLATGADFSAPFEIGNRMIHDTADRRLLAVEPWDAPDIEADDQIGLIDLDVFNATDIPYPDLAIGDAPDAVRYELVVDGNQLLIAGTALSSNTPDVVWTGESWSSAPADLRRLQPVLRLPFGTDTELQLIDGAGDVAWSVPGFRAIGREGFNSAITDSVALAMECLSWTEEFGCSGADGSQPDERLVAFDLATGDELWSRPGSHSFALIDGDRGIVTADLDGDGEIDGWELIDLRNGERVDDVDVTTWADASIFRNACCGEGDYVWTRLDGGVLFESLGERIRVWLPPEFTSPTVSVELSE